MDIDGLEGTRVAEMIYRGRVVFFKSTISKNPFFKNILLKMHSASLLHMDIDGNDLQQEARPAVGNWRFKSSKVQNPNFEW